MTVRELTKQFLDFNPDANIKVRLGNGTSVDFTLAWGALDGEGMNKERTSSVTIYVEGNEEAPQDNFCKVCNLPTDGVKCYSKRCPV